jgi:hypothetical protein
MRNKEKVHEWIDRYNTNNLTDEEFRLFIEMVNRDPRLKEEVLLDSDINTFLKGTDLLELRKKISKVCAERPGRKNANPGIMLMAASVVVLVSMGWMMLFILHPQPLTPVTKFKGVQNTKTTTKKGTPGLKEEKPGELVGVKSTDQMQHPPGSFQAQHDLLACYQPDKTMENLIGTTNRAAGFMLVKPEQNSIFFPGSIILFHWVTDPSEETSLIVENNRGIVRYASESNTKQSVCLNASFLGHGLFYFKILRDDEIVCFGKFVIRDR